MAHVLVVAGTTEATELAGRLDGLGHRVVSSLAGVTSRPVARAGQTRSGGFGGAEGLARFLVDEGIDVVIDATHPFAATMPFNVASAARAVGIPHCRLLRPPWYPEQSDRWIAVSDLAAAADQIRRTDARRVFLAVGRQSLAPFRTCGSVAFVVRSVEPIGDALPGAENVALRGRPDLDTEIALLRQREVELVVSKNSGGAATAAKVAAARHLGLPVVMVGRPPQPEVMTVSTVDDALDWLDRAGTCEPTPDPLR